VAGVRDALRALGRDSWVLGIAGAAAIALAATDALRELVRLVLSVVDQPELPADPDSFYIAPFTFRIGDRVLQLEPFLVSGLTLLLVVVLAAVVLSRAPRR
jgi:hypothetical protein